MLPDGNGQRTVLDVLKEKYPEEQSPGPEALLEAEPNTVPLMVDVDM